MDQTYLRHSYFVSCLNFTEPGLMIINYYFTIVSVVRFATIVFAAESGDLYCHIDCFYYLCYQHVILDQKS